MADYVLLRRLNANYISWPLKQEEIILNEIILSVNCNCYTYLNLRWCHHLPITLCLISFVYKTRSLVINYPL